MSGVSIWLSAISARNDEEWQALAAIIGAPSLARLDVEERRLRHDEIDAAIASYCSERDRFQVMERLQAAAIPAAAVQDGRDLLAVGAHPACDTRSRRRRAPRHAAAAMASWRA